MKLRRILFSIALLLGVAAVMVYVMDPNAQDADQQQELFSPAGIKITDALNSADDKNYLRALAKRSFAFPADHGPHPDYKNEWWYFTGNLEAEHGRHFGFELTFFRIGLSVEKSRRASQWASREIYMAHFTLTDVTGRKFYYFERFSRAALDLAGADASPFRVWLEDWRAQGTGAQLFPLHLNGAEKNIGIDLILSSEKPVVLQGDAGLSRKSATPGNASYYYSLTRLNTMGVLHIGTETFTVSGSSWMDREWPTSALDKNQAGWDWFALQLGDGRELMFYRLRRKDGAMDANSSGSLINPDGTKLSLAAGDVQIEVSDYWTSPHSGIRYPAGWRLRVQKEKLDLRITPYLADQELNVSVRYWEGAVRVDGTTHGKQLTGTGYVELAGYEKNKH